MVGQGKLVIQLHLKIGNPHSVSVSALCNCSILPLNLAFGHVLLICWTVIFTQTNRGEIMPLPVCTEGFYFCHTQFWNNLESSIQSMQFKTGDFHHSIRISFRTLAFFQYFFNTCIAFHSQLLGLSSQYLIDILNKTYRLSIRSCM